VALAILIWFIAAMSIIVAGIVMQARVDIKLTQLHKTRAQVEAAADGAVHLALAELAVLEQEDDEVTATTFSGVYELGGVAVVVNFVPLAGLVDLNMAPEELLSLIFSSLGNLEENEALALATGVVEWRSAQADEDDDDRFDDPSADESNSDEIQDSRTNSGQAMRYARFEAAEDLMLVPGVDRRLFEAVRDAVYVSQTGQSGFDWMVAPPEMLIPLGVTEDDLDRRGENSRGSMVAPEGLDLRFQGAMSMMFLRADARAAVDGDIYLRRRWVERGRAGQDGLPWRFFRTEPVRSITGSVGSELVLGGSIDAGN